MIGHSYATDTQTKAADLATTILAASSPPQIASACAGVEAFLQKHSPDQARWFFSITFPTLICKIFGFEESSSAPKPQSPNGWVDTAALSDESEISGKLFSLLSPNGVLLSSVAAVDRLCVVKYVFPNERLPEWVRFIIQNGRDYRVLADLCPLFKNRIKEDSAKSSTFQVQLNIFEYYMFWFIYYPVCRGNSEGSEAVKVRRSKRFRLENWAYTIPGLSSSKRGTEQKNEGNLYIRLLYSYLRAFIPMYDLNAHQPYRSSLLHYSRGYDASVIERSEFLVNAFIHFWLIDNDFSPFPVTLCKSYGVLFPFRSVWGEIPPTSGLGEVINVLVKYLTVSSIVSIEEYDKVEWTGSPQSKILGSIDVGKARDATYLQPVSPWDSWIQRSLYRFILRSFLFCPVETSVKNVSQVFSLWITYMEPWKISLEEFAELDAILGMPCKIALKDATQTSDSCYSSSWQWFLLANYLYYSSLVMHFIGFAHRFLHTDPEVIIQMVSKVINILTSSKELMDLVKDVDAVFHSKPTGSSKSLHKALYRLVPTIRENLQDWEYGLCESDADGSFLHENWNRDLQLFSDSEEGGQQLLQLFVLRAESELQALSGDSLAQSLQFLDSLKAQLSNLFGGPILKSSSSLSSSSSSGRPEASHSQHTRDEIFCPRSYSKYTVSGAKYKGDWMMRPITGDEVAWLAKLLVKLSVWLNESLGLNQVDCNHEVPAWSYVDLSGDVGSVSGLTDTMKIVFSSFLSWLLTLVGAVLKFMRKHGMRVNLRILASKNVLAVLLVVLAFSLLKRGFA